METKVKAYKVFHKSVSPDDNTMYSFCGNQIFTHVYQKDITTFRRVGWGPLAVFGNIPDVANFLKDQYGVSNTDYDWRNEFVVYECEITPSLDSSLYYPSSYNFDRKVTFHSADLPENTVFADSVKPIKKIRINKRKYGI